jgi:Chs5-Arf1p-binding protein BUD7/BCH1
MMNRTVLPDTEDSILFPTKKRNEDFLMLLNDYSHKVSPKSIDWLCWQEGWQLGSDPEIQVANVATNHLTTALMRYFCITGRWEQGVNLFQKLREREPDVDLLLAQLYLEMGLPTTSQLSFWPLDEEVKAVDLMCTSLIANPLNYGFLVTQATFLLKKNRPDLAIELAKAAVNANPSEYATWAILTESYIAINDFENVLPSLPPQ